MTSLYNLGGKGKENMPSLSVWLPAAVGTLSNPTEAQHSMDGGAGDDAETKVHIWKGPG